MTKRHRDQLKREAAQALHDLDRAGANLNTLLVQFEGVHDDYATYLLLIMKNIQATRVMIIDFWGHAWGIPPDNFDSFRT